MLDERFGEPQLHRWTPVNSSSVEESTGNLGAEVVVVFFRHWKLLIEGGGN